MSIVNDALKKAGKEFESNDQSKTSQPVRPLSSVLQPRMSKKTPVIIPFIFVAMVMLLGILFLRRNAPETDSNKPGSMIQSTLNNIEQKNPAIKSMRSQNIAKLNGIVYGDEGKWAIVNDKIVKEGDSFLGGEITSITRDLVKIENKDGNEIVLNLK